MSATAGPAPPALARAGSPALSLVKEARALAPTFGVVLVTVVVGSVGTSHTLMATGLLGFAVGAVTLGAMTFGLEYSHRTLGLLLSQPVDRRRLYFYKLAVLVVMLATLSAAALLLFHDALQLASSPHTEPSMLLLVAACALFVAPWLAMLCRSTLAAVVFTIAIPGLLATGADIVGAGIYGLHNAAAIDRFELVVFWRGMFLICALSAIAGWRMFLRLEVIEGHGPEVQFPVSLGVGSYATGASPIRRHHPVWALVTKEARLQQMAFVVAAIYVLVLVALAWLERFVPNAPMLLRGTITVLYAGVLAMLIGSLASAEERRLGTLEWQALLPMPAWQQWAVKVGMTVGLAALLGVGLPSMLELLFAAGEESTRDVTCRLALTTGTLAIGSLYLSSLCGSGVAALVLSFPGVVAVVLFVQTVGSFLWHVFASGPRLSVRTHDPGLLLVAIVSGLIGLLLWLAYRNHRSADGGPARIVKQMLAIAAYIMAGLTLPVGMGLR